MRYTEIYASSKTNSVGTSLVCSSLMEFGKRSATVFVFWAVVGIALAMVYSELVTRVYTTAPINTEPKKDDADEEMEFRELSADELDKRRLLPHQIFAFGLAIGLTVVAGRIALELLPDKFSSLASGLTATDCSGRASDNVAAKYIEDASVDPDGQSYGELQAPSYGENYGEKYGENYGEPHGDYQGQGYAQQQNERNRIPFGPSNGNSAQVSFAPPPFAPPTSLRREGRYA